MQIGTQCEAFRRQGHANRSLQGTYPSPISPQHSPERWNRTKAASGRSPAGAGDLEDLEDVSVSPYSVGWMEMKADLEP